MTELLILLAQTTAPATQGSGGGGPPGLLGSPLIPLALGLVLFWWILSRGRRKEQRRYQQMLAELKKNDRVQTIGGILGTVVDVRDNEVVLKVDESSNVKVRFNRGAIKEVLRDAPAPEAKG